VQVVVAGTEGSQEEAEENETVGPTFAGIEESDGGSFGEKKNETHCSEDGEWEIGSNVAEVGDAEPGALVRKIVIGERLGDASNEEERSEKEDGNCTKNREAGTAGNHLSLLRQRLEHIQRRCTWSEDDRRSRYRWSGRRRKRFGWRSSLLE